MDVSLVPAFLGRELARGGARRVDCEREEARFRSPGDMVHVVGKLRDGGATGIWQTDRGTTFGYQTLVVDLRSFPIMAPNGCPTILDVTHNVQLPGAGGGKSSGHHEFVEALAKAALAAGAGGLFLETHPDPANAISDGPNLVPLNELAGVIERCLAVWRAVL